MYARINDCITLANMYPDMPVIQCEYSHMMGNSGGNLVDYWQSYHRFPRLQGGFIWDWVDQGLHVGNILGGSKWAYGGDFGEVFHDSNFCLNGLNWPDRGLGPILAQYHFNSGVTENMFTKYNGATSARGDDLQSKVVLCNHIYGLASKIPSDLLHEMVHVDLGMTIHNAGADTSLAQSHEFNVEYATSKPTLLEAKQCMKYFECMVTDVCVVNEPSIDTVYDSKTTRASRNSSFSLDIDEEEAMLSDNYVLNFFNRSRNGRQNQASRANRFTSTSEDSITSKDRIKLNISVGVSLLNQYDHIEDMMSELAFDSYLLCDGMIVAYAPVKAISKGVVHCHTIVSQTATESTGKHSIQEIECDCQFTVTLYRIHSLNFQPSPVNYVGAIGNNMHLQLYSHAIFGDTWPETAFLDQNAFNKICDNVTTVPFSVAMNQPLSTNLNANTTLNGSINQSSFWTNIVNGNNKWSVVIIGKLNDDRVWAPRGFPLGICFKYSSRINSLGIFCPRYYSN